MRQVVTFVVVMAALGVGVAQYGDRMFVKSERPKATAMAVQPAANSTRTVTLRSDNRGHFEVEARVDGRRVDFMVDTGASVIALRESSAARLGIHPTPRDYNVRMQTANGEAKAARVTLNRVEVNGITVRDVVAVVAPDHQLGVNLLGMSFLSRVKWSHDRGRLVLEQ